MEGNYPCSICDDTFISKVLLDKHHEDKHNFTCDMCSSVFGRKTVFGFQHFLVKHIEEKHKKEKQTINCVICHRKPVFGCKEALNKHIKDKHSYTCDKCPLKPVFGFQKGLRKHIKEKHNKEKHTFTCDICPRKPVFGFQEGLNKHKKEKHSFTCDICPLKPVFDFQEGLNKHIIEKHTFTCSICPLKPVFDFQQGLNKHIKEKHFFTCDVCPLKPVFGFQEGLNKHIKEKHTITCNIWSLKPVFGIQQGLNKHIQEKHLKNNYSYPINEGDDTLTPEILSDNPPKKVCVAKSDVKKKHTTSPNNKLASAPVSSTTSEQQSSSSFPDTPLSSGDAIKPIKAKHYLACSKCKFTTVCKNFLSKHIEEMHITFSCDNCGKSFRTNNLLKSHKEVNSIIIGNICTPKKSQNVNEYSRNRIFTKDKPYSCDVCGKSFHQGMTLIEHKRKSEKCKINSISQSLTPNKKTKVDPKENPIKTYILPSSSSISYIDCGETMKEEIKVEEENLNDPLSIDDCSKDNDSSNFLNSHIMTEHNINAGELLGSNNLNNYETIINEIKVKDESIADSLSIHNHMEEENENINEFKLDDNDGDHCEIISRNDKDLITVDRTNIIEVKMNHQEVNYISEDNVDKVNNVIEQTNDQNIDKGTNDNPEFQVLENLSVEEALAFFSQ